MEYNKPINIHVNTYREARITAIRLVHNDHCDSNLYSLTRKEWESDTPLYVNTMWWGRFIITK